MKHTASFAALLLALARYASTGAELFVAPVSPNPTPPYSSWATAATNIQAAVDVAPAGSLVMVSNGVYLGSVVLNKAIVLSSLNGARATLIDGGGTNRCLSVADGAWVWGFTLTNGYADRGAGVWAAGTNCFLTIETRTIGWHYGHNSAWI